MAAGSTARIAALAALAAFAACGGTARPSVTGRQVYDRVGALQSAGHALVGDVDLRTQHVLATDAQVFAVAQLIENCKGGEPTLDVECALALVVDQRFTVLDKMPERGGPPPSTSSEDRSDSLLASAVVVGLGVAAIGALGYGAAVCEFPGCKAVFGVPLVFVGVGVLILLVGK